MKDKKKLYLLVTVVVIFILLDQISKMVIHGNDREIISGVLNFTTTQNTGGAFGIGQNSIGTFIITNIIVIGIIIRFMITQKDQIDNKTNIALCFVISGGISNLIDRIFRGYVIDFIDFSPIINFPKFNMADIYITIGWIVLAAFFAVNTWKEVQSRKNEKVNKN